MVNNYRNGHFYILYLQKIEDGPDKVLLEEDYKKEKVINDL